MLTKHLEADCSSPTAPSRVWSQGTLQVQAPSACYARVRQRAEVVRWRRTAPPSQCAIAVAWPDGADAAANPVSPARKLLGSPTSGISHVSSFMAAAWVVDTIAGAPSCDAGSK